MRFLIPLCLVVLFSAFANAYIVEVSPKDQECFFEELERGERMISSYEVLAGGMLDINIKVVGPDAKVVFESEREQEGSFQFSAIKKGIYQVCFNNAMSTMTSKIISFNIYAGHNLHQYQNAKASHMKPLDRSVMTLTESIRQFVDTYHYIRGRILTCHNTAVSTNSRVFWWGVANTILLVVALYVRTALTKRPFDKKTFGYQSVY